MKNQAQLFFEDFLGKDSSNFVTLAQSGSARANYLASDGQKKYIVTQNDNIRENEAFFYFTGIFSELKLNTPKIFKINKQRDIYIQEFLGEKTLSEEITNEGLTDNVKNLVQQSLEKLYHLQVSTDQKIDYQKTFEYQAYNELPILHDLYYFKNFLIDVLEMPYHKSSLLEEFYAITHLVEKLSPKGLMIRDFQSRNIMVDHSNAIQFIDYQAAMYGPLMYDVISFLYQAKANFPDSFKEEMLSYYYSLWNDEAKVSLLKESFDALLMMRYLQVLGAYGFRGLIQRKKHFLESLDKGIDNIYNLAKSDHFIEAYPELQSLIFRLKDCNTIDKIKELSL